MEPTYEVVFYGTDAAEEEALGVMQRVGELLKLDEQQIVNLFDHPNGITLLSTSRKAKAEHLMNALLQTGALCNLRDAKHQRDEWESWELEDKGENLHSVFHCRACNYAERLPRDREIYGVCPQCGVVQAKYDDVTQRKLKRERVRRRILSVQDAKAKKLHDELEREREDKLRKDIEKEIRREMGSRRGFGLDFKSIAAATAVFTIGVGSTVAYYTFSDISNVNAPTLVATEQVINRPMMGTVSAKTIFLANDLLERLGATPLSDTTAPGSVLLDNTELSADLRAEANLFDEPWKQAPATAAGSRHDESGRLDSGAAALSGEIAVSSANAAPEIIGSWYARLERDPIRFLYLAKSLGNQQDVSQHIAAEEIVQIADSPNARVALIAQIASAARKYETTSSSEYSSIPVDESASLEEQAATLLAQEILRENNQVSQPDDNNVGLKQLFSSGTKGTLDQLHAQAFIAAVRASDGDDQTAKYWFSRANDTLNDITDPSAELLALSRLAGSYVYANDTRTALELVARVRTGLHSLSTPEQKQKVAAELVATYAAIGMLDQAVFTVQSTADSSLQADISLTDLAIYAARKGGFISAQGILSVVHDAALKAHTKAQISVIAQSMNQPTVARDFADGARRDSRGLASPLAEVVASQLLRAYRDQGIADTDVVEGISTTAMAGVNTGLDDRARILIAANFAWAGDLDAAKRIIAFIDTLPMREKADGILQSIEALRSIQAPQTMRSAAI